MSDAERGPATWDQPTVPAPPSPLLSASASTPPAGQPVFVMPPRPFTFDGGAGTYFGVALAGLLVTVLTLGICLPWAIVMIYRWRAKHTYINGQRLQFTGSAPALFGHWIKWLLLIIITAGIYAFWVAPRLTKWVVEHQEFESPFVVPATYLRA